MKRKAGETSPASHARQAYPDFAVWRESLAPAAREVIEKKLAPKAKEMDDYLRSEPAFSYELPAFDTARYRVAADGTMPDDDLYQTVLSVIERIKFESAVMMEDLMRVKTWIQMSVPKAEDGNNFGVEVQEEMIDELQGHEIAANKIHEDLNRYFIGRGKLVAKRIKYPECEDYARVIHELDLKRLKFLRQKVVSYRNGYLTLLESFKKNAKTLLAPKGSRASQMMV